MISSQSLQIAVVGVGGIGSTFAFQLARAGNNVTAIARPDSIRLQQLQREGGIINTKGERAAMRVTETLDEQTSYDLIIVTLLAAPDRCCVASIASQLGQTYSIHVQYLRSGATAGCSRR